METSDQLIENGRLLLTLNTAQRAVERSELANCLFLKGQVMERMDKPKEEIIKLQDEAIELEELNARISKDKKKTPLLAKLYRVKAQLIQVFDNRFDEALEIHKKAADVYKEIGNEEESAKLEQFLTTVGFYQKKKEKEGAEGESNAGGDETARKDTVDDDKEKKGEAEEDGEASQEEGEEESEVADDATQKRSDVGVGGGDSSGRVAAGVLGGLFTAVAAFALYKGTR